MAPKRSTWSSTSAKPSAATGALSKPTSAPFAKKPTPTAPKSKSFSKPTTCTAAGLSGERLSGDDLKKKLCQICETAGANWVKTSSGYGFVKQPSGAYNYQGATEHDLALMRAAVSPKVQVKAAGGVRDLDGLIRVRDLGASRCGASATKAMLDEYKKREAAERAAPRQTQAKAELGQGGY